MDDCQPEPLTTETCGQSSPPTYPPVKSTSLPASGASALPPASPDCPTTSISGRRGSPARTSAALGGARDCTAPGAACSLRLFASCMGSDDDRFFCSWRTCLLSELAGMTGYALNWKEQATPSGQEWWVLGRSERRTGGTGCGSSGDWQTARAHESGQYQRDRGTKGLERPTLTGQAKDWQTRDAAVILGGHLSRGGKRKGELLLAGQAKEWTTPQAHDSHGAPDAKRVGRYGTKHGGRNLPDDVAAWPTPTARDHKSIHASPETHARNARPLSEVVGLHAPASRSTSGKRHGCSAYREYIEVFGSSCARVIRRWWNSRERQRRCRKNWKPLPSLRSASLWSPWVAVLQGYPCDWCDMPTETP